jgi:hypothetical protein
MLARDRYPSQGILNGEGKYHCTIDLLFGWFGISCMTTDNFCFYLQKRLIQTSRTGGQWYSDAPTLSIPCPSFFCSVNGEEKNVFKMSTPDCDDRRSDDEHRAEKFQTSVRPRLDFDPPIDEPPPQRRKKGHPHAWTEVFWPVEL